MNVNVRGEERVESHYQVALLLVQPPRVLLRLELLLPQLGLQQPLLQLLLTNSLRLLVAPVTALQGNPPVSILLRLTGQKNSKKIANIGKYRVPS